MVAYHLHVHATFNVFQGHSSVKQFKLTWSNSNSDIYVYIELIRRGITDQAWNY